MPWHTVQGFLACVRQQNEWLARQQNAAPQLPALTTGPGGNGHGINVTALDPASQLLLGLWNNSGYNSGYRVNSGQHGNGHGNGCNGNGNGGNGNGNGNGGVVTSAPPAAALQAGPRPWGPPQAMGPPLPPQAMGPPQPPPPPQQMAWEPQQAAAVAAPVQHPTVAQLFQQQAQLQLQQHHHQAQQALLQQQAQQPQQQPAQQQQWRQP
jgi:hypothetical protein